MIKVFLHNVLLERVVQVCECGAFTDCKCWQAKKQHLICLHNLVHQVFDRAGEVLQTFAWRELQLRFGRRPLYGPCRVPLCIAWRDASCLIDCTDTETS